MSLYLDFITSIRRERISILHGWSVITYSIFLFTLATQVYVISILSLIITIFLWVNMSKELYDLTDSNTKGGE